MNPEALKLQEAATEVFNKKLFLKILQNWREIICEGVSFNSVFNVFFNNVSFKISDRLLLVLRNFREHLLYRVLRGDCFWIGLIKKFNCVANFLLIYNLIMLLQSDHYYFGVTKDSY